MLTKQSKQIFMFPDGSWQSFPNETDAEGAVVVDAIAESRDVKPTKDSERAWRNEELTSLDFKINDYEDRGLDTGALRAYRVALRNHPQQSGFPDNGRPKLEE